MASLAVGAGGPAGRGADPVTTEAVWTTALLSYARCFSAGDGTSDGRATAGMRPPSPRTTWPPRSPAPRRWSGTGSSCGCGTTTPTASVNPRERFSVGVAQDADGAAAGVAITSIRQPLVDDVTVRQMGAVAYALSAVVDARIGTGQERLFEDLKEVPPAELDQLATLDVALSDAPRE